jgi:hypothetical protein
MKLPDVYAEPRLMADLLAVPFEDVTTCPSWSYYNQNPKVMVKTAECRAREAMDDHIRGLREEFNKSKHNPWKEQTWHLFVTECLREGLGIRRTGKLADKMALALMMRPDLYAAAV